MNWLVESQSALIVVDKKRLAQRLLLILVGTLMGLCANHLLYWHNEQLELFNAGLDAYKSGDMVAAVQRFDDSIAVYNSRIASEGLVLRAVYGQPDRLVAARAAFQKGKALIALTQSDAALTAYKQSLTLNPGSGFAGISLESGLSGFTLTTAQNWQREARITQYNLELLFAGNASLAKKEGLGQEKSSDDQPPPGTGPASDSDDTDQF